MQVKASQPSEEKIRPCGRGLTSPVLPTVLPTDIRAVPAGEQYRSGWVRLSLNAISPAFIRDLSYTHALS